MAIKYIELVQVICDDCGRSIMIDKWQDASKLDWMVPIDGAIQRCPACGENYKKRMFREAKLAKIADDCPFGRL